MSPHLVIIITIFLCCTCLHTSASSFPPHNNTAGTGDKANNTFFKDCPPTRCSNQGPTIRFPFRLKTSPWFCGLKGFELSCLGEETLLHLPFSGDFYIQTIDYLNNMISIVDAKDTSCPLQSLLSLNLTNSIFNFTENGYSFTILNCTERIQKRTNERIVGPINCLSAVNNFVYMIYAYENIDELPSNCFPFKTAKTDDRNYYYLPAQQALENISQTKEIMVWWSGHDKGCSACERQGTPCGFDTARNQTMCLVTYGSQSNKGSKSNKDSHTPLIIGISIGGTIILVSIILIIFYLRRKRDQQKETRLKVERFLANYKTFKPIRYTFSDIKKITGNFKQKLGQGGFGSVYKGNLLAGIPVAVKMLEISSGSKENFVNEVATIGRIHHVNVVRLLGFCSEGTRHALIYEFMPNGSLEKFILPKEANTIHKPFTWEKLQEITIDIARGIEYLHQGCDQRILHFDIKPHNVLLDHNFHPKISDFGLAKLCSKEQSIVSMSTARGTIGYIAPELLSRNFGSISYKSDVYSFGMLMLEIIRGRKNLDITMENLSQIYFPEWIYDQLSQGKELGLDIQIQGEEEIIKKLAIVALWCIQWNPVDRPSMTMVVRMLEGDFRSLKVPPKPFISS